MYVRYILLPINVCLEDMFNCMNESVIIVEMKVPNIAYGKSFTNSLL